MKVVPMVEMRGCSTAAQMVAWMVSLLAVQWDVMWVARWVARMGISTGSPVAAQLVLRWAEYLAG